MKDFLSVIRSSQLFSGVTETELAAVLACLDAKKTDFPKEAYLMHTGDTAEAIGLVLSGSVLIVQEDIWGNRHILSKAGSGQTFAAAFACAPGAVLNVSVVAQTPVTVMFLNVKRILTVCTSACSHHSRLVQNLLYISSQNASYIHCTPPWRPCVSAVVTIYISLSGTYNASWPAIP